MNSPFFIILGIILSCFLIIYTWLFFLNNRKQLPKLLNHMSVAVLSTLFLGTTAFYFLLPTFQDTLFEFSYTSILVLFLSATIAYIILTLKSLSSLTSLVLLITCAAPNLIFFPQDFLLLEGRVPLWADRGIATLIWGVFAWGFRFFNSTDGIFPIQCGTTLFGIIVLSFLGGQPILLACISGVYICVLLALAVYNWHPAQLPLKTPLCQTIGFLSGWLFFSACKEGATSCIVILNIYFFCEIIIAHGKRLLRTPQYNNTVSNTIYFQASVSGLSPHDICSNIFKLNFLLVLFSGFQAFSPNPYSLFFICLLLTIWFLNRMYNWQILNRSYSEINQQTFQDIKKDLNKYKESFKKDK